MEMKHALPLLCLFLGCSSTYKSPTIVEWRGEDRNGIYHDASLLRSWPEEGPRQLWFFDSLGSGYGSPVIEKGLIYITGAHDSTAWLHCLDAKGILQWQVPYGREWVVNFPGSRSAPTLVDDLMYVGSGTGELVCLEKANGEVRWSRKFEGAESLGLPRFGHSESAVVDADLVFWTPGGSDHNVVALNRFTGELQWSNPGFGERSAYHPPRVISHAGRRILVCMSAYHLMGMDAETLHRVATIASGGLDSLPHSGAVVAMLTITQLTHRQAYRDVGVVTVLIPVVVTLIVVALVALN